MINKEIIEAFRITPEELDTLEKFVDRCEGAGFDETAISQMRGTLEKLRTQVLAQ